MPEEPDWEVLNPLAEGAAPSLTREELERSIVSMHEGEANLSEEEWQALLTEWRRRGCRALDFDESAEFLRRLRSGRASS